MPNCKLCHADLDANAIQLGRCPVCDAPIPNLAPQTVDNLFPESVDEPLSDSIDISNADTSDEIEEMLEGFTEAEPGDPDDSLDIASDAETTIEIPPSENFDAIGEEATPLEDEISEGNDAEETDASNFETLDIKVEGDKTERSTHAFDADVTVDLTAVAGGAIGAQNSGQDAAERDELEKQVASDDSLQTLDSQWEASIDLEAPIGQTIRQTGTVSGFKSSLPIKSRNFTSSDSKPSGASPGVPANIPDYELLNVIGQGGMGVVYAAKQSSIARTVAVKMLKSVKKVSEEQRDKFISEAVVTGELDHPNIVPIYDLGANESGALFYSMKRVNGTPWDDVIKKKGLDENLQILMRVADAIAFAHDRGVIHRDLKPENTMLGDYGEVLVMDWGLARVTSDFANSSSIYQADSLGGTPAYMAPEMARGPVETIDFRSDIYLLGAMLYEIIGGKPPHSGRDVMQCLMAAAQNRVDPIEYDGELKVIAMRAMATQREDRYPTIGDFQGAVRVYQSHSESLLLTGNAQHSLKLARENNEYDTFARSVFGFQEALNMWDGNDKARTLLADAQYDYARLAYDKGDYDLAATLLDTAHENHTDLLAEISKSQRERDARQWRLRNMRRMVAALALAIVGILSVAYFQISKKHQQAVVAQHNEAQQRKEADRQKGIAQENEAEAVAQKEEAHRQETEAIRQKGIAVENEADALTQKNEAERQKGIAVENESEAVAQRQRAVAAKQAQEYEAYVARIGLAQAKIEEENAFDVARSLLEECPQVFRHWEWGRLSYLCDLTPLDIDEGVPVDAVAFSPDQTHCISGNWNGEAIIRDVVTGEEIHSFKFGHNVHAVAYSPDGKLVAIGGSDNLIHIVNAETGAEVHALRGHEKPVLGVRFSPNGRELVSCSYDKTARLWEVGTGKEIQKLQGHTWWVFAADFSPDGTRLVTAGQDGRAIVWERDAQNSEPFVRFTEFPGHEGAIYTAQFSPDGKLIATGGYDRTIMLWNPDETEPIDIERRLDNEDDVEPKHLTFAGHEAPVRSIRFSPIAGSNRLVSASHDNTLRIWDTSTGKQVTSLRGHGGRVRSCDYSPDGTWLISGGHDNHVRLWDVEGYQEVRAMRGHVLAGHEDAVLAARFSPDGKQVVTASRDRTARLWDAASGKHVRNFEEGHQFLASTLAFFGDGRRLATGAGDSSVRIWDVASGTELQALSPTGRTGALAVSPDGKWIVTGSQGNDALIWSLESGAQVAKLTGHKKVISSIAYSPDGSQIVTGDERGALKLWQRGNDPQAFELQHDLKGHRRPITAAVFASANRLVTASGDGDCIQWDTATGQKIPQLLLDHPKWVSSLDISTDGQLALTTCEDGVVRIWSLDDAQVLAQLAATDKTFNAGRFAPDGRMALLTSAATKQIHLWPLGADGRNAAPASQMLKNFDEKDAREEIWAATYSPDGKRIATIGGNDARLWDLDAGKQVVRFSPHNAVAAAAMSRDGRYLITGSWDRSAKIWDTATGRTVRRLDNGHSGYINSVEFSPNNATILTASDDGTARLWDFASGKPTDVVFRGHTSRVFQATFSPDGSRVLTASGDKTARIWDRRTGQIQQVLEGHQWGVLCGQFSPDGKWVLTGSIDNMAKVWHVKTGKLVRTLKGHTSDVTSVAFSPDGLRVLTGSQDNLAKLWDPKLRNKSDSAKEILSLTGHEGKVTAVSFSPDGRLALTGSQDGTAIIWPTAEWRENRPIAALLDQRPLN